MRGKDKNDDFGVQQIRITPAYAGKSFLIAISMFLCEDHPRLCGEKLHEKIQLACRRGSPPPMRGKDSDKGQGCCIPGITPAYAGKSLPFLRRCPDLKGSPPPMRGKDGKKHLSKQSTGITPAYAGKSLTTFLPS